MTKKFCRSSNPPQSTQRIERSRDLIIENAKLNLLHDHKVCAELIAEACRLALEPYRPLLMAISKRDGYILIPPGVGHSSTRSVKAVVDTKDHSVVTMFPVITGP